MTRLSKPKHSWIKSHVELSELRDAEESRMECPTERREVPGMEETQECDSVMCAAGLQL